MEAAIQDMYINGTSIEDIAEIMDIKVASVKEILLAAELI